MNILLRKLFCLAGIYDEWIDKETGKIYRSFAVITTDSNKKIGEIHHRMPVILTSRKDEELWLESGDMKLIKELMGTYDIPNLIIELRDKEITKL